jgi:serine/threonine-protein kinase
MARVCQRCNHANGDEARFCLQCGNMLEVESADSSDPLIGRVLLGRYRVMRLLGEGGMGKVYQAEQKMGTATRNVAIKTLHPELGNDPQLVARFHRECETVIELSHPNTVQFYDFGDMEDGTLFIVMELIEGESLAHVLERGAIEPGRADRIIIQICGSLHEAHQRGVVHRDLKPENVLLTERGGQHDFVKVLDFGIAKRSEAEDDSSAKLTKQGMVLGTPPYMSPEQFSGQALDARSDIYSLGVMTYEMLAGSLPFEAATPWEWATKHLTAEPTPIDAHPSGAQVPDAKKAAIAKALAKDRDQRFAAVLDFMHDFTGLHDAQAAWTLATTPGTARGSQGGRGPEARSPVGTPQPMPQSGAFEPTRQAPSTGSQQADIPSIPGLGGGARRPAKVVAAIITGLVLLGLAGGGAWYLATDDQRGEAVAQQQGPAGTEASDEKDPGDVRTSPPADVQNGRQAEDSTNASTSGDGDEGRAEERASGSRRNGPSPEDADEVGAGEDAPNRDGEDSASAGGRDEDDRSDDRDRRAAARRAAREKAQDALRRADAAVQRNDVPGAVAALGSAQRVLGRSHPGVRDARRRLASQASNQVGTLLLQNRCEEAQGLYRRLRSVGAHQPASHHFADWCKRP